MGQETQSGRAIVFGATGGIGSALVAALAERSWTVAAGSRSGKPVAGAVSSFAFDLCHEPSVAAAAATLRAGPAPDLVLVATGALVLPGEIQPENAYRALDPAAMAHAFQINTIGPALIAKHVLPLLPRDRRSVFAALGARVGSIGDNRLGGWHSYRASKAALAMLLRNFAIEMARSHPQAIIVGLHPGTVDTALSAPFQRNVPKDSLLTAQASAGHLLTVMAGLSAADSGKMVDWQGDAIAP